MKFNCGIAAAIVVSIAVAGLAACEKGPAERAGKSIDNAAENFGDKIKDAAKDAKN